MSRKAMFFSNTVPDVYSNIVAEYKFEDNYVDSINGYNGTQIGTVGFATDLVNRCVLFTGSEANRVDVAHTPDLRITDGSSNYIEYSFSFIIKMNTVGNFGILSKRNTGSTNGQVEYIIAISPSNKIKLTVFGYTNPASNNYATESNTPLSVSTRYSVGVSFNPNLLPSNPIKITIDGIDDTGIYTLTGSPSASESWGNTLRIGCNYDTLTTNDFNGYIDELYMYKGRALNTIDFREIYNINLLNNSI